MATHSIASQAKAAKVGATIMKLSNNDEFLKAAPSDFQGKKVALFIHGFTKDASNMIPLMRQFEASDYSALAFNYPCYDGIDNAAHVLFELLAKFDILTKEGISSNRIVVVGHSMGGLVARALVGPECGYKFVRKVFTLGSPNAGTLIDSRVLHWFVTWGESVSGLVHGGFSKSARSALQLMRADGATPYLESLQQASVPAGSVEFHSFSGGKNYLTFGETGGLRERVLNIVIQRYLNDSANDGLVLESSSDLSDARFAECASGCVHVNNYPEHKKINHSHLCENQMLNLEILARA